MSDAPSARSLELAAGWLNYEKPLGPVAQRGLEDLARLLDEAGAERYKAGANAAFQTIVSFMESHQNVTAAEIISVLKSRL